MIRALLGHESSPHSHEHDRNQDATTVRAAHCQFFVMMTRPDKSSVCSESTAPPPR